ncbi:sensor histidine kinase [Streptomyces sp. B1866]|uniref:sensor histidine kinase n=1 Tax=Streptomyces sp. B1866 TaxID=3075431 RepID=UPI00288E050F|nr:sensor histidine kinase [Streptomyces sp. B1866]MDT3400196.1 sensor histidine kinase [Streptomyces sp. B1866]
MRKARLIGRPARLFPKTPRNLLPAPAAPWVFDALLGLSYTAVSLLLGFDPNVPPSWRRLDATGSVLTCLISLSTVFRRTAPVAVACWVAGLWTLFIGLDYWPVVNSPSVMLVIYTVAATRPARTAAACAALMVAAWIYGGTTGAEPSWPAVVAQSVLYAAVLCRFGAIARTSEERNVRLTRLTARLRREQEQRERRAVAEERVRIARELHDIVAHHMSVISVQAGLAGYVFDSDPPTARTALSTISGETTEALEEMRRLLSVLRVDPDDGPAPAAADRPGARAPAGGEAGEGEGRGCFAPAPGLDRLEEVVERVRGASVRADLAVTGARRPLPAGLEQCAYRVVQEALTNVIKHAPTARVAVRVDYGPDRLTVTVVNDAGDSTVTKPPVQVPSTGHGLIGMRERARIYGGHLDVGPLADGGFRVRLTLPVHTTTGRDAGEETTDDGDGARRR